MNKTVFIGLVGIIVIVGLITLYGKDTAEAPIVDEACATGYARVGEGCMPLKDACELGGDQYYFNEATEECVAR